MSSLIHADIFFFITTIAVIFMSILLIIVLIFVILILKNLRKLSQTVLSEADLIAEDIDALRTKAKGWSWAIAYRLFRTFLSKKIKDRQNNKSYD